MLHRNVTPPVERTDAHGLRESQDTVSRTTLVTASHNDSTPDTMTNFIDNGDNIALPVAFNTSDIYLACLDETIYPLTVVNGSDDYGADFLDSRKISLRCNSLSFSI